MILSYYVCATVCSLTICTNYIMISNFPKIIEVEIAFTEKININIVFFKKYWKVFFWVQMPSALQNASLILRFGINLLAAIIEETARHFNFMKGSFCFCESWEALFYARSEFDDAEVFKKVHSVFNGSTNTYKTFIISGRLFTCVIWEWTLIFGSGFIVQYSC